MRDNQIVVTNQEVDGVVNITPIWDIPAALNEIALLLNVSKDRVKAVLIQNPNCLEKPRLYITPGYNDLFSVVMEDMAIGYLTITSCDGSKGYLHPTTLQEYPETYSEELDTFVWANAVRVKTFIEFTKNISSDRLKRQTNLSRVRSMAEGVLPTFGYSKKEAKEVIPNILGQASREDWVNKEITENDLVFWVLRKVKEFKDGR